MSTITESPLRITALAQPTGGRSARWLPLGVITAAHLMAVLDITVMFVALPSAQHALGMSVGARQWVLSAYTLAFASLLLLGGRLADRLGARRTLIVGAVGFAAASAVGGASLDGAMLIAARAVQGAFGAVLVSSTKSLLVTVYSGEHERTRAVAIFGATLTVGMALGLILGGVLTSCLGWRWCLYINLAVCLVVVPGALRTLPQIAARGAAGWTRSARCCARWGWSPWSTGSGMSRRPAGALAWCSVRLPGRWCCSERSRRVRWAASTGCCRFGSCATATVAARLWR